ILLAGSTFLFRLATALIPELAPFKDSLMLSLIKSQQDVAWAQLNTDTRLATFDNEERLAWEPQFRQLNDLTDSFGNIVPDGIAFHGRESLNATELSARQSKTVCCGSGSWVRAITLSGIFG
ncbi:hypothetical protein LTS18_006141, partial [Coniosporium uncinatum]